MRHCVGETSYVNLLGGTLSLCCALIIMSQLFSVWPLKTIPSRLLALFTRHVCSLASTRAFSMSSMISLLGHPPLYFHNNLQAILYLSKFLVLEWQSIQGTLTFRFLLKFPCFGCFSRSLCFGSVRLLITHICNVKVYSLHIFFFFKLDKFKT